METTVPLLELSVYPPSDGERAPPALIAFAVLGDLCIHPDDSDALEEFISWRASLVADGVADRITKVLVGEEEAFFGALLADFWYAGSGVDELAVLVAEHRSLSEQDGRRLVLERLSDFRLTGLDPVAYALKIHDFMEERLLRWVVNELWLRMLLSPHMRNDYRRLSRDTKDEFLRAAHAVCLARREALVAARYTSLAAELDVFEDRFGVRGLGLSARFESWPPFVLANTANFSDLPRELASLARAYKHVGDDLLRALREQICGFPPAPKTQRAE